LSTTRAPDGYLTTVFGAIKLALAGTDPDTCGTFLALELFRPGVPLPLSLLQLAVQVYTGVPRRTSEVWSLLEEVRDLGLVESFKGLSATGKACCYQLLPLVTMYLDKYCTFIGGGSPTSISRTCDDLLQAAHAAPGSSSNPGAGAAQITPRMAAAGESETCMPASLLFFQEGTQPLSTVGSASRVLFTLARQPLHKQHTHSCGGTPLFKEGPHQFGVAVHSSTLSPVTCACGCSKAKGIGRTGTRPMPQESLSWCWRRCIQTCPQDCKISTTPPQNHHTTPTPNAMTTYCRPRGRSLSVAHPLPGTRARLHHPHQISADTSRHTHFQPSREGGITPGRGSSSAA
jgi:hypothetical protein